MQHVGQLQVLGQQQWVFGVNNYSPKGCWIAYVKKQMGFDVEYSSESTVESPLS